MPHRRAGRRRFEVQGGKEKAQGTAGLRRVQPGVEVRQSAPGAVPRAAGAPGAVVGEGSTPRTSPAGTSWSTPSTRPPTTAAT
ncbi:hypothetical protein AB0K23_36010, partial [Streptomyces sp. NPDC049602]